MKNKKVLMINIVGLNYEGITSVIYNYVSTMDRNGLELNFLGYHDMDEKLKRKFQDIGTIHYVHHRKKSTEAYIKDLNRVLSGGYDVVHIHGNSGTMAIEAVLAKLHHVKKIIIHCHNTTCDHKYANEILKLPMKLCATDFMACSHAAGTWLYKKNAFLILNNAIHPESFRYDPDKRIFYRKKFGIDNEFVIGHSGRFHQQKNHDFLIDVFAEYQKRDRRAKLLLLSNGPKLEEIRSKVKRLALEDSVIFAGRRSDANEIYSAMDLFLLPSLWEGLPLVMLEAQANGLPLLVSDVITKEAKCTRRTFYFGLEKGAAAWADRILEIRKQDYNRGDVVTEDIRDHGFDINYEADKLRKIYLA